MGPWAHGYFMALHNLAFPMNAAISSLGRCQLVFKERKRIGATAETFIFFLYYILTHLKGILILRLQSKLGPAKLWALVNVQLGFGIYTNNFTITLLFGVLL